MPRGKKKVVETTPVVVTSPVLKAIQTMAQNQTKILKLGEQLANIERQKADLESQISVLMGTSVGTPVVATTPRGRAAKATKATKEAAPAAAGKGGRRGPKTENDSSLGDLLYKIVKDADPMSINELSEAATKAGYKSSATNFPKVVRQSIDQDTRFRKVKTAGKRDVKITIA